MSGPRHNPKFKCECGRAVAVGSVFCPFCRSEVQKENDKVIKREEDRYQMRMKLRVK